jgi:hypothetical protein
VPNPDLNGRGLESPLFMRIPENQERQILIPENLKVKIQTTKKLQPKQSGLAAALLPHPEWTNLKARARLDVTHFRADFVEITGFHFLNISDGGTGPIDFFLTRHFLRDRDAIRS